MSLLYSGLSPASRKKLIFLMFVFHLVMLVVTLPVLAEDATPAKEKISETGQVITPSRDEEPAGTVGIARCYAKRYKGRRTSSGAIYNPKKLTAAHPSISFGTRVKVVNLANNKSVIVTINDRCREHEESFIDLSSQAARQLGMIRQGMATVRIIPIEEDHPSDEVSAGVQN